MNLLHYMLRPYMPLPDHMVTALGLSHGTRADRGGPYRWYDLTDSERDRLAAMYPPMVSVATFTENLAGPCRISEPLADATTDVIAGAVRSACLKGSPYPKGDN